MCGCIHHPQKQSDQYRFLGSEEPKLTQRTERRLVRDRSVVMTLHARLKRGLHWTSPHNSIYKMLYIMIRPSSLMAYSGLYCKDGIICERAGDREAGREGGGYVIKTCWSFAINRAYSAIPADRTHGPFFFSFPFECLLSSTQLSLSLSLLLWWWIGHLMKRLLCIASPKWNETYLTLSNARLKRG